MALFPSYATGTISITAGATTANGTSVLWTDVNARPGDILVVGGLMAFIADVPATNQLTIPPWAGATVTNVAYTIYQNSAFRIAGAQTAAAVNKLVAALNADGFIVFVPPGAAVPDASYGNEGQYARKPTSGEEWLRTGGVWVYQGISIKSLTTSTGTSANLNTIIAPGAYFTPDNLATNTPFAGNYWYLEVLSYGNNPTNFNMQRLTRLDAAPGITYTRTLVGGTWQPWRLMLDDTLSIRNDATQSFNDTQKGQLRQNAGAWGVWRRQIFTASGTYTPHAQMIYCNMIAYGGGGGGGAAYLTSVTAVSYVGGGGAAGGRSEKAYDHATVGTSRAVTIGAGGGAGAGAAPGNGGTGGDTFIAGGFINARGGVGGSGSDAGTSFPRGGQGVVASAIGDVVGAGAPGTPGTWGTAGIAVGGGGVGGSTLVGSGGKAEYANAAGVAPTVATGYGSGGGGGAANNAVVSQIGGAGMPGLVVIDEFCAF